MYDLENLLWLLAPTFLINGLVVYLVGIHWGRQALRQAATRHHPHA